MTAKSYRLTINTDVNTACSVFKRAYILTVVDTLDDGTSIASFKSEDYVPNGYVDGGKGKVFFQNKPIKMNLMELNKCISKLALKFDTSVINGTEDSLVTLKKALKKYATEKIELLEI